MLDKLHHAMMGALAFAVVTVAGILCFAFYRSKDDDDDNHRPSR
jgi:cytochrome bd-type quinol oxidase subunit 1